MDNKEGVIVKEVHGELSFNPILSYMEKINDHLYDLYIRFLPQFPFAKKYFDFPIVSLDDILSSTNNELHQIDKTYIKNGKSVTLRNSYFAFFTCSCGDMGCAGIFDYVYVSYTDTTISWIMNIEEYCGVLDIDEKGYLEIIFDRKQYEEAVENLRALLENIDTLSISKEIFNKIDDTFCEDSKISMLKDNDMVQLKVYTPLGDTRYYTDYFFYSQYDELKNKDIINQSLVIEVDSVLVLKHTAKRIDNIKDNRYSVQVFITPVFPYSIFSNDIILSIEHLVSTIVNTKQFYVDNMVRPVKLFGLDNDFIYIDYRDNDTICWYIDLTLWNNKIINCNENCKYLCIKFNFHQYKKAVKELIYICYYTSRMYISLKHLEKICCVNLKDKYDNNSIFSVEYDVDKYFSSSRLWNLTKRYVYNARRDYLRYIHKKLGDFY